MRKGIFFQLFATIIGNLMAISDGMTVGWTSPMIPYFLSNQTHIDMTSHEAEWLETLYPIGSIIGLPFTVFFVNVIGRKKSLLLGSLTMMIQWIAIATSYNVTILYVARVLAGMAGDMSFVAAPAYISEIADKKIRGCLSSVIFLMQLIGVLSVYAIGTYFPFCVTPIFASCLITVELVLFSFLPETPYYLLSQNNRDEAKKSLLKFRDTCNVDVELDEIAAALKRQQAEKSKITDLYSRKSYKKSLLIILVLNAAQQFGGINVIIMNLHIILEEAGSVYIKSSTAALLFSLLMLIAAVCGSLIVDKFGRKKLLISSSILTIICLVTIGIYFNIKNAGYYYRSISWIPVVSVMVYAVIFKIGVGMVPIIITAEIFASKIKALGMSFGNTVYTVTSIGMIQLFAYLKRDYGMEYSFYLFAGSSLFTTIFMILFIPETKGKSLDEIQIILEGKSKPEKELNAKITKF